MNIAFEKLINLFKSNNFGCLFLWGCSQNQKQAIESSGYEPDYIMKNRAITVDGNIDEWEKINSIQVNVK
ncbi:MAG: hypothetical protein WKF68_09410 [Daejeonella sp.]